MRITRLFVPITLAAISAACGAAVRPDVTPKAPSISSVQKMSWILRMEDERILRVPAPPAPPPPPEPVTNTKPKKGSAPAPPPPPIVTPDLTTLVTDPDPRIRRRAALAIGRVGLPEGAAALQPLLTDTDPDVRQMAAFALGLLADTSAVPALTTALQDADARVRGRAAEALGLIGDTASAPAVGQMVAGYIQQGAIASLQPDDDQSSKTPEADAVRLGLFALVRQKGWLPLASAVLDSDGKPVSNWWPVAFALQRINDPRALPALQQLAHANGRYAQGFAIRGLGALKDRTSVQLLIDVLAKSTTTNPAMAFTAIEALSRIGAPEGGAAILTALTTDTADPNVRLEAVAALAAMKYTDALPYLQDLLTDDWPAIRAAALRGCAAIDPQDFVVLLSGLEPDPHWIVRSAMAELLGGLPPDVAVERLKPMLNDPDKRVVATVVESLTRLRAPGLAELLLTQLKSPDEGVRIAAARGIGQARIPGGAGALRDAFAAWSDPALHDSREEALTALARYPPSESLDTVKAALADEDWALRLQAAALMHDLDPSFDAAHAIRPAPGPSSAPYDSPELIDPQVSPHAFIETAKGTIEVEFTVLDAPQTVQNFITLARRGYFNGLQVHRVVPNFVIQDGDPRGDGSGGPGYTIRDELNDRPFVRGAVGMALSGPDTGGSQFFIMHSPAPHLDAKFTVFGKVVNGMDAVDKIAPLDVIERVRIWDGKELK
jgi:cyclophilin family peptidyl-prolyl cis-trans isomerase/HEAT repeat protein